MVGGYVTLPGEPNYYTVADGSVVVNAKISKQDMLKFISTLGDKPVLLPGLKTPAVIITPTFATAVEQESIIAMNHLGVYGYDFSGDIVTIGMIE